VICGPTAGLEPTAPCQNRIRIIEVFEYAALRDLDRGCVGKLIDLLAEGLKR